MSYPQDPSQHQGLYRNNKKISKKQLQERFPKIQHTPLLCCKTACPLNFTDRIVLSVLLFRCRRKKVNVNVRISKLAELTGFKWHTVRDSCERLRKLQLASRSLDKKRRYKAMPEYLQANHKEWFGWLANFTLGYSYCLIPEKPMTFAEAVVWAHPDQPQAVLATWFQLDRKTVRAIRTRLAVREYSPNWWKQK